MLRKWLLQVLRKLKGIKAKKIIWKKDGAKMVRLPFAAFDIVPPKTVPAIYDKFGDCYS